MEVVASPRRRPSSEPDLARGGTPSPSARRGPPAPEGGSPAATVPTALKPSARPGVAPRTAARPSRANTARQPRSAFTVVETNETITDVAVRVYGTAEEADVLWRANRDAMPRQDSPLAPGTLLRTPMVR